MGRLRTAALLALAAAVVVSADVAPDAAGMLLLRGRGDKEVWISQTYYSCTGGNAFAMVWNGRPGQEIEKYGLVEAAGLSVYVPNFMSFEGDVPKIVTFPRKNGVRDVGVSNSVN